MGKEGRNQDFKLDFNHAAPGARMKLIKQLVGMANAGGGQIIFGQNETRTVGVEDEVRTFLDSANLANLVESCVKPSAIDIAHDVADLGTGKFVCTVHVGPTAYPIVMARSGNYVDTDGRQKSEFEEGDIWTRHSSKTEKVRHEDVHRWIDEARQTERERLLSSLTTLVNLPPNARFQVVSGSQVPIDSPKRLLEYATARRRHDSDHVLGSNDLAWLFANREGLAATDAELGTLLASALRRSATLFWWLVLADGKPHLVLDTITECLAASDRDKSDASNSIVELAAIYADDDLLADIIAKLRGSRYHHFREVAAGWSDRETEQERTAGRIARAKHGDRAMVDMSQHELDALASKLALDLVENAQSFLSRKLGDATRVLWSRRSRLASALGR